MDGDASVNTTLQTADGVAIDAGFEAARPGAPSDRAIIVAHGFTGHRRQDRVRRITNFLRDFGAVISIDFRGHGASGGRCTVGLAEVHDVAAAIGWARDLNFDRVATVGFSMGGAVVLRQAALHEDSDTSVDQVVSVSGPAFWYYRGTAVMRLVHNLVMNDSGRFALRLRGIRMDSKPWPEPPPMPPVQAIRALRRTPALIVHGDRDRYFPMEHAHALARAGDPTRVSLMSVPGFGHAEAAIDDQTLMRIGNWITDGR
jgi:pimeloyl-ACP methyl ester carboxylesterase